MSIGFHDLRGFTLVGFSDTRISYILQSDQGYNILGFLIILDHFGLQ